MPAGATVATGAAGRLSHKDAYGSASVGANVVRGGAAGGCGKRCGRCAAIAARSAKYAGVAAPRSSIGAA
ncbi:hypothetical protein A6R72_04975 [Xanthomonas translucens pv. graminis]|nr:hypothetical protein A6R72_04975 [Xanthomonas translucens pv. graminis]